MKMLRYLRRFRDSEDGVISIELLFAVPILLWTLISTIVYFDAYHAKAVSTRAALTVADMISREEQAITPDYLTGTREVLRALSEVDNNPDFRLTVFRYRAAQDDFRRIWSRNRGLGPNLTNTDLENLRGRFPPMANGDRAILLETRTNYQAPMKAGIMGPFPTQELENVDFETFTIIKPRYTGDRFCWDPTPEAQDSGDERC
ncbi:MAG: hypothetical protein AAF801_09045 [Pseudomonadota bacterium]